MTMAGPLAEWRRAWTGPPFDHTGEVIVGISASARSAEPNSDILTYHVFFPVAL